MENEETKKEVDQTIDVCLIGAEPFYSLAKCQDHEILQVSMRDIFQEQEKRIVEEADPRKLLPNEYHEFLNVFSKKEADTLPVHRKDSDHHITLEGPLPDGGNRMYPMSREELDLVRTYIEENLTKGFIEHSKSPYSSPVLFVRKPGGGLRFCVDYRKLNSVTRKDQYPLPLIDETIAQIVGSKWMTRLDIRHAFNRCRMATEEDEDLTSFKTRFGAFKYKVMPFGLTNGPATFQRFINKTLWDFLNIFASAYMEDILTYSRTKAEHTEHVRQVLDRLREAGLQVDIKKCEFSVKRTKFLGMIVGPDGIQMDPSKVSVITDWVVPKNLTDIQAFLEFCNFYRRFIQNYSKIVTPLTSLTKKGAQFLWTAKCQEAFEGMKKAVTTAPILQLFDWTKEAILETDCSDLVAAGVLSQQVDEGLVHPVAFYSGKLLPAECNYEIHDKELLAIMRCLDQWRPELEGTKIPFKILTDHQPLEYFMTSKKLNRRQARWAQILAGYNFKLSYRPGKANGKADALTRRSSDKIKDENDDRQKHQHQTILVKDRLDQGLFQILDQDLQTAIEQDGQPERLDIAIQEIDGQGSETILQRITEAQATDEFCQKTIKHLQNQDRVSREITLSWCSIRDGLLYYKERLWVPENCHVNFASSSP